MVGWHHRLNGHEFELVMDKDAWRAAVHEVAKSWTRLSNLTELKFIFKILKLNLKFLKSLRF